MKALIVSAELFEDCELLVPYYRLQEEGYQVDIAAPLRGRICGKHGYVVEAGKALRELDPDAYAVLILPGGKAPEQIRHEPAAHAIAQAFFRAGKPVAAICHGPLVLLSAACCKAATSLATTAWRISCAREGRTMQTAKWWWTAIWSPRASHPTCPRFCARRSSS